jgi:hypothetical protein
MKKTSTLKTLLALQIGSLMLCSAAAASDVIINGRAISNTEKMILQQQIGQTIVPGNYISDGDCWVNLSNGSSGCLSQGSVNSYSRYGSGSYDNTGNWNVWSNAAGGAVGGTSDGCVYTSFGWSNC